MNHSNFRIASVSSAIILIAVTLIALVVTALGAVASIITIASAVTSALVTLVLIIFTRTTEQSDLLFSRDFYQTLPTLILILIDAYRSRRSLPIKHCKEAPDMTPRTKARGHNRDEVFEGCFVLVRHRWVL